jgi:bacterioferritin-associated ferredoxin
MIVCHCQVVNDRAVANSIAGGAQTLAQVCSSTGAGRNCGACVFSVRRLLCQHGSVPAAPAPEIELAAS